MNEEVKQVWEAYKERLLEYHREFDQTVNAAFELFMKNAEAAWGDLKKRVRNINEGT